MIPDPREDSGNEFVIGTHWKRLQDRLPFIAVPPGLRMPFIEPPTLPPEPFLRARFQLVRFRRAVNEDEVGRVLRFDKRISADLQALIALAADTHELEVPCAIIALGSRVRVDGQPFAPTLFINPSGDRGIVLYPIGRPSFRMASGGFIEGVEGTAPINFRLDEMAQFFPRAYFPPDLLFLVRCPDKNGFHTKG